MYTTNLAVFRKLSVPCPLKNSKDSLHSSGVGKGFTASISKLLSEKQVRSIKLSAYYDIEEKYFINAQDKENKMRMFNYPDGISNSTNTLTRTSPRSDYPVGCTLTEQNARSLALRQYINDSIIEFLFENLKRYTSNERYLYVSLYCIGTLLNLNKPC